MKRTMSAVSIAEARNTLTRLIHKAEDGEPVHITRHGKPVAVLVSRDEYERLSSGAPKKDFWQAVEDWRAQAGFDWPGVDPGRSGRVA